MDSNVRKVIFDTFSKYTISNKALLEFKDAYIILNSIDSDYEKTLDRLDFIEYMVYLELRHVSNSYSQINKLEEYIFKNMDNLEENLSKDLDILSVRLIESKDISTEDSLNKLLKIKIKRSV